MLNAYEQRLLAFYLANAAAALHHRDREASDLAEWIADRENRMAFGGRKRRSPLRAGKVGRDEGMSGGNWRSLQAALREEYSAVRKARPDRTGQRLRRLARATGLTWKRAPSPTSTKSCRPRRSPAICGGDPGLRAHRQGRRGRPTPGGRHGGGPARQAVVLEIDVNRFDTLAGAGFKREVGRGPDAEVEAVVVLEIGLDLIRPAEDLARLGEGTVDAGDLVGAAMAAGSDGVVDRARALADPFVVVARRARCRQSD